MSCRIFTPDKKMVGLLKKISKRFPTALLSNTNDMHTRYFEKRYAGILKPFDHRVYSFREKMRKPDATSRFVVQLSCH